ncbi:hypothetical protein Barb4_00657 [Bacteroidales bacterium Barb4]|nr:hypothetical protein Barb4_00657 [Bacteroidales bacterium Barb4]
MTEYIVLSELTCVAHSLNPTFRCAACGAEIGYPFRILKHEKTAGGFFL